MEEFLQYGALALCVMAFILLKLSGRDQNVLPALVAIWEGVKLLKRH